MARSSLESPTRSTGRLIAFYTYDVLIISLTRVPIVDLSGAFSLEDLVVLAQKRNTKVILTGANVNVRRILNELSILKNIGIENVVETFDIALTEAIEYMADLYLSGGQTPLQAEAGQAPAAQ